MDVKPSELRALLHAYVPQRLPVLVTGAPGIGKSDIVEQVARTLDYDLLISHPVVEDPTDSKGLPFPDLANRTAHFLPFGDLCRAMQSRRPLLWFFDDLGQASEAVQAAKMQLLLARRIGEHKLPEHVTFVAATNRRSDNAGVSGLLDPVISRFATVVNLVPDHQEWSEWAIDKGVAPELIAFLRFRPDLLLQPKVSRDIANGPSPRTWNFIAKTMPHVPAKLRLASFAGSIGEGAATEFLAFLEIWRDLPSPQAVLLDPGAAPIPENPATLFALSTALAANLTEGNFDRALIYFERLLAAKRREFGALMIRDAVRRNPALQSTAAFIKAQSGPLGRIIQGE
ncbi:ATP-binding protein (plasmid) [Robbsia andropogonis]|uniref:ATP-binding protein n=1 Tax=Robbsia andropogonis TaxID=28092 RepID=UPI003D1E87ED